MSATSEDCSAASVPAAPMATPTRAAASAGASLMPSPTIAVRPAAPSSSSTARSLSSGSRPARTSSAPTAAPTEAATRGSSPVSITTRSTPARRRPAMEAAASGRGRSASPKTASARPSSPRTMAVRPRACTSSTTAGSPPSRSLASRGPPAQSRRPPTPAITPRPGSAVERLGLGDVESPIRGGPDERRCEGMLGAALDGGDEGQRGVVTAAVERDDVRQPREPQGQRAGLVDGDGAHPGEVLERLTALDEDAVARRAPDRGHDGNRDRDDERARAGDDEQRERPVGPRVEAAAERDPEEQDGERPGEHQGRVHACEAVDEALRRRARALRLVHERRDPREGGVAGRPRGAHRQRALRVQRPGEHGAARLLVDRHRLTGDGRLVDAGAPAGDLAVEGDALARAHGEARADRDLLDGDQALSRRRRRRCVPARARGRRARRPSGGCGRRRTPPAWSPRRTARAPMRPPRRTRLPRRRVPPAS